MSSFQRNQVVEFPLEGESAAGARINLTPMLTVAGLLRKVRKVKGECNAIPGRGADYFPTLGFYPTRHPFNNQRAHSRRWLLFTMVRPVNPSATMFLLHTHD